MVGSKADGVRADWWLAVARTPGIRPLAGAALVNTAGDGLYIAGSALFFTKGLGLPVSHVGLGLMIAGVVGLAAGPLIGRLADRHGARRVLICVQLTQCAAVGSFVVVGRSLVAFVAVAAVLLGCMQGADAAQGALVGSLGGDQRVALRAALHSVANIGISIGAVGAAFLIAVGTRRAYDTLMLADAATFFVAAALVTAVPTDGATSSGGRRVRAARSVALRDRRYLSLAAANAVMSLQYFVLAFAMPLWVIDHTRAPRWLVSPMLLTNTVLIVVLQVRFSRSTATAVGGARSIRRAGFSLAAAMGAYAAAAGRSTGVAVAALIVAVAAHSVGELLQGAGSYGVSYDLAADGLVGEYLAVYGLGIGVCRTLAPALLAATCLRYGQVGWLGLAVVFVISGMVTPLLVRRRWGPDRLLRPSGAGRRVAS